ncbi:MAG: S8 family serine peptidase [Pseudobacteriovorax sp.]|nr:S8 family serine peptidase [Pseudobacteriovorax sp.]
MKLTLGLLLASCNWTRTLALKVVLTLFVVIGFLAGFGYGNTSPNDLADSLPEVITLPSEFDIRNGNVAGTSFLVAFRDQKSRLSAATVNLNGDRYRTAQRKIMAQLSQDSLGVEAMSFITSLNLSKPNLTFTRSSSLEDPTRSFALGGVISNTFDVANISRVEFQNLEEAEQTLRRWHREKLIWYAEPNYQGALKGELEDSIIEQFDDNLRFPWLSQVGYIDAMRDFNTSPATNSPVIAVLDSGVDVLHPALKDNVYVNEDGQNKLCVDDVFGCDTTNPEKDILGRGTVFPAGTSGFDQSCNTSDNCAHGTHVAGIVAARSTEYVGLCPYCQILVVKVVGVKVDENGKEDFLIEDSAILAGLAYVSGFTVDGEPLVRVINASFGKFQKSRTVGLFIEALKNFGKGILMVAAAGNEDTMKRQYPAAFEDVIAVANVLSDAENPRKARSSNFGMWVDISAPGSGLTSSDVGILSSTPGQNQDYQAGTSMSSPVVAGIAGLVLAREPDLNYQQLRDRVLGAAIPDALYRDGVNNAYRPNIDGSELIPLLGGGIINAQAAVNPSSISNTPILTQKRDAVSPGCGVVGQAAGSGSMIVSLLVLLPFLLSITLKKYDK